ncbi:MAG: UDP-N-acetylmuramate--L-alanine ligase, partial [Anaerolineae bacterium]|nr:UDP-N-acetylmuramate--L-alanine ligase [Anaerolineae bacterium]
EFLAQLLEGSRVIGVAGTHGKTTTTAMLAWLLAALDLDPSYIIGGVSANLGSNAHAGDGEFFVIEADEYDRMFLGLNPEIAVVTYLEHDHPDCFPTPEVYRQAFEDYVARILPGGSLIASSEHQETFELAFAVPQGVLAFTFGINAPAHYRISDAQPNALGGFSGTVYFHGSLLAELHLQVPGRHNLANALAALAVAHRLGLDVHAAAAALNRFMGTGRRFELVGEANGIMLIDDYAHHPTEIRATLAAARARFPQRRIWAVWQPHTYTRTRTLMGEFQQSFDDADQVVVTEIYAARENTAPFSALEVVHGMRHPNAHFIASLDEVTRQLLAQLKPGDVVLVLSAGDADRVNADVLNHLTGGKTDGNH